MQLFTGPWVMGLRSWVKGQGSLGPWVCQKETSLSPRVLAWVLGSLGPYLFELEFCSPWVPGPLSPRVLAWALGPCFLEVVRAVFSSRRVDQFGRIRGRSVGFSGRVARYRSTWADTVGPARCVVLISALLPRQPFLRKGWRGGPSGEH